METKDIILELRAKNGLSQEELAEILSSERAQGMRDGFRCGTASEELCLRCGYAQKFVR